MVHPEELNGREFDGGSIHKGVQDERALLELCESRMHGQGLPLTRSEAESQGVGATNTWVTLSSLLEPPMC